MTLFCKRRYFLLDLKFKGFYNSQNYDNQCKCVIYIQMHMLYSLPFYIPMHAGSWAK